MAEEYSFFELKIPYKDTDDYKKIVLDKVSPFINALELKDLINGFHFIMHQTLDLRVNPKNEFLEPIQKECRNFNLPAELKKIPDLPPEQYGGAEGVKLCYEILEYFSRLIIRLFKENLEGLTPQFIHYLYIQQGINNIHQIYYDIIDAIRWVNTIESKHGDKLPIEEKEKLGKTKILLNQARDILKANKK